MTADADPDAPPEDDPVLDNASDNDSPVEEVARKHLGLRTWDRPALYRDTAEAATDSDVPFWAVLLLSGAIATFGLILNSTAVVIGAMLVAPLLGPLLGLSMALAVGDGRLLVQTAATLFVGAASIIALAALLTWLLPFHAVTDEIAARTRPTTLDLAIAVCSGLAGAVVTASREARLSASIPGVAVAVALVPPLGTAGFGIAVGQSAITSGALLLFGANLAGIVLSGLGVFLLVGMQRADVVKAARAWHEQGLATGLAATLSGARWLDRLPGLASTRMRVLGVVAFMAAVSVPLTSTLSEVLREARVASAVDAAEAALHTDDRAFVIDRDIAYGDGSSTARLRVATPRWITDAETAALSDDASKQAGEPVTISLEQILASDGDLEAFAQALPSRPPVRTADVSGAPTPLPTTLASVRGRLADALGRLALPDSVRLVGGSIEVETEGSAPVLEVAYGARRRLSRDAETVLARQAATTLGLDPATARAVPVRLGPQALPDSAATAALAALLDRYPRLRLTLAGDTAAVLTARQRLVRGGAPPDHVRMAPDTLATRARLTLARDTSRTTSGG